MKNLSFLGILLAGLNCYAGGMIGEVSSRMVADCHDQAGDELTITESANTGEFFASGTGAFAKLSETVTRVEYGHAITGFTSSDFNLMIFRRIITPPANHEAQVQYPLGTVARVECVYNGIQGLDQ